MKVTREVDHVRVADAEDCSRFASVGHPEWSRMGEERTGGNEEAERDLKEGEEQHEDDVGAKGGYEACRQQGEALRRPWLKPYRSNK